MADLKTHYQPHSPAPSPTEDEEEQIIYAGASNSRSFTNGTMDSNLMNNGWGSSFGASSSKKRSISTIPNMISHGYMNGLGSSSGTSSFPAPPSLPTEDELLSSFQGLLSVEEQKLYAAYGASNSMITSPGQLSTHSSSLGTSSWKYPSFENSTMISQGNYVGNSFVNSRHSFFSLKKQGWNDYRIMKIMNDDPSLLDELNGYDILMLGSHKLGCKYLMKLLCNECEAPRLTRLLGSNSADFFKAIVYVITNEVSTKYGSRAMENLLIKLLMGNPTLIVYVLRFMKPSLFPAMLNQNGSQLVQKLCQHVPNMYLGDLYEIAVINCVKLSTTEQGCFALKAIIDSIIEPFKTQLLSIIIGEAVFLSAHDYGNFVVQHVLERHPYTASLISNDNVVEKCIESNATDVVVSQLLSDCKQLVELAQDKFGNYVVQKALKLTKGKALRQLVEVLHKCSGELENHPNGRNVYNLIKRFKLH
ncbi:hypothetical protein MKW92_022379 [Papaver armeniacum]|nr:hypothetical protein MKW92_022379 [Papaver armeniacum]